MEPELASSRIIRIKEKGIVLPFVLIGRLSLFKKLGKRRFPNRKPKESRKNERRPLVQQILQHATLHDRSSRQEACFTTQEDRDIRGNSELINMFFRRQIVVESVDPSALRIEELQKKIRERRTWPGLGYWHTRVCRVDG